MSVAVSLRCYALVVCFVSYLDAYSMNAIAKQAGTSLNLSCACQDCMCAGVAWYCDNVPIDPSKTGPNLSVQNSSASCTSVLRFAALQLGQSGWYTCAAADTSGRYDRDFLVIVNSAPALVFNLTNFTVYAASNTTVPLLCPITGVPLPAITWYQDVDSSGKGGTTVNSTLIDSALQALMIPAVGLGTTFFKCIATNDYGEQNATVAVTISNSSLALNTTIKTNYNYIPPVLECITNTSVPQQASFFWLRNGVPIPSSNRTYTPREGGYYCCGVNTSDSVVMFCTIIAQPNSTDFAVVPAVSTSVAANRNIYLICSIDITNLPIYYDFSALRWLVDRSPLQDSSSTLSYLSIDGATPDDSNEYSCTNGASTVTTNITVLGGCGLSNAVKSPGAENSLNDIYKNWNFIESSVKNVYGENCYVGAYNSSTHPYITQEITQPEGSTRVCISARIRHVGLPEVTPMVCLVAVGANDIESTVVCLPHPFPSSPAWYWVQTEISLLDKDIESTTVKLMVVLTVDNPSEAGGMVYFDDITVSFSNTQLQPFIIFVVALAAAVAIVSCFAASQLCCKRKTGIQAKVMKRLTLKFSRKSSPPSDNAEPYMIRLLDRQTTEEKRLTKESQQTHFENEGRYDQTHQEGKRLSQSEQYYYVDDTDKVAVFIDRTGKGSDVIVINQGSLESKQQVRQSVPLAMATASTISAKHDGGSSGRSVSMQSSTSNLDSSTNRCLSVQQHFSSTSQCQAMAHAASVKDNEKDKPINKFPSGANSLVTHKADKTVSMLEPTTNPSNGHNSGDEHVPGNDSMPSNTAESEATQDYEPVDLPEPPANTAELEATQDYEPVDMPTPPANKLSEHVPGNDSMPLNTAESEATQDYEPVDMPAPPANKQFSEHKGNNRKSSSTAKPPDYKTTDLPTTSSKQQTSAISPVARKQNQSTLIESPKATENNYTPLTWKSLYPDDANTYDSVNIATNTTAELSNDSDDEYL